MAAGHTTIVLNMGQSQYLGIRWRNDEGMERMEAEKQAGAKVVRSKSAERKAANKTDIVFALVREGRGSRIGMKIGGWRRRIATICNKYINTETKQRLIVSLQLPDYDRMSSGFVIVAEENIAGQITYGNANYTYNTSPVQSGDVASGYTPARTVGPWLRRA